MMKETKRWFLLVVAGGCLVGGSFLAPVERLQAAPALAPVEKQALISINKADTSELEKVRGIGPALAERIVQYREANGRFERLEDLVRIPGIGQGKFERIRNEVTL